MRPNVKQNLKESYQLAFDTAANSVERNKLYKSALDLGIKLETLNENFTGLKNFIS